MFQASPVYRVGPDFALWANLKCFFIKWAYLKAFITLLMYWISVSSYHLMLKSPCYVAFTVFTLYLYILFVVNVIYFFRFLYYALVFHTIFWYTFYTIFWYVVIYTICIFIYIFIYILICWCSLEGLMLKLKLQYFGHLMRRVDSLEKTLILGGFRGRRGRGWQRMRWLDGITDSMDMGLS